MRQTSGLWETVVLGLVGFALLFAGTAWGYEIPANPDRRISLDLSFTKSPGKGSGRHTYLGYGPLGWTKQDIETDTEILFAVVTVPLHDDMTIYGGVGMTTSKYRRFDGEWLIDPTFVGTGYTSKVIERHYKIGVKVYLP